MTGYLVAFLWGFAEATLFFIVPDVALSVIALKGSETGLTAAGYALAGAMTGGAVMYYWGQADLEKVARILHRVPLIPAKDIAKVQADLQKSGPAAMLFGPLFGIPYKIYASYAHRFTSIAVFLLISIPARGVRFFVIALVTPYIFERFFPGVTYALQVQLVLALWFVLYVFYFFMKRR